MNHLLPGLVFFGVGVAWFGAGVVCTMQDTDERGKWVHTIMGVFLGLGMIVAGSFLLRSAVEALIGGAR